MLIQKFNYQPLSRTTEDGKRLYNTPDGNRVASVTTILDKTKPQENVDALIAWRKRVGYQQAQTITTEAAGVGTAMHKMLEDHCLDTSRPPGSNQVHKIAYPMKQKIVEKGLVHLNEVWGVEVPLYFPGLYAGTTDLVGVWKGQPAIIDFKQTNRPKKDEYVYDYKMQLCAYSAAHNAMHGTNIRTGVILMCSRACEYQEWVIQGDEYDYWLDQWWTRVETFYS